MSPQSELLAYNGPVQVFGMTVNILALLGSSLVVLTGVIFSKEMTNKKIFMKLILFVSLCDIMADIPGIFGFVHNNGPLCVTQAVTMHFFALASWLWCTMISLSLYSQMKYGTVYMKVRTMNFVIWPVCILMTVLPLAVGLDYGNCDIGDGNYKYGTITSKVAPTTKVDLEKFAFLFFLFKFLPLLLCLIVMVWISVSLSCIYVPRMKKLDSALAERALKMVNNASIYPIIMVLVWIPNVFVLMFGMFAGISGGSTESYRKTDLIITESFTYIFGGSFGFFLAIGFFIKSAQARRLWNKWLLPLSADEQEKLVSNMVNESQSTSTSTSTTLQQDYFDSDSREQSVGGPGMGGSGMGLGVGVNSVSSEGYYDDDDFYEDSDSDSGPDSGPEGGDGDGSRDGSGSISHGMGLSTISQRSSSTKGRDRDRDSIPPQVLGNLGKEQDLDCNVILNEL